jgi:uncharacterized membrane protein
MVSMSIGLAFALVEVEKHWRFGLAESYPLLFGAGAEGSRGMLSTIAGSMITVAGLTFSLTIAALATASGQYTSRVLRNFMRDRHNQIVLGCFVGIFSYCLVVLRTVRGETEGAFVPSLAVFAGLLLALVGIGVLVFFIHHIATSIQASTIIAAITDETLSAVDHMFPSEIAEGASDEETERAGGYVEATQWRMVHSSGQGYVQTIDADRLVELAQKRSLIVRLETRPGDFVAESSPLLSVTEAEALDDDAMDDFRACVSVQRFRTIDQELGFGIRQLVDIAQKALSPGVNDTTTAVMCIDHLGAIMARLAARDLPTRYRAEDGRVRLITRGTSFADMLDAAFDEIRGNASGNVVVVEHLMGAIETAAARTGDAGRRDALAHHLKLVADLADRTIRTEHDRAKVKARMDRAVSALDGDSRIWETRFPRRPPSVAVTANPL